MSLLKDNTEALNIVAALSGDDLRSLIGDFPKVNGKVVCVLYNEDIEGSLNILLKSNPAGIVTGLAAIVKITGAKGALIITNSHVNEQEIMADANIAGVELEISYQSIVNKAKHEDDYLINYLDVVSIANKISGNNEEVLITIDDEAPQSLPSDTKIADLIKLEDIKGIFTDHKFYSANSLDNATIGSLNLKSYVIHTVSNNDCVVTMAKEDMARLREKSCGKCTFCREGLYQLSTIFEGITKAHGKKESVELAEEIAEAMQLSCNCTLGDAAGLSVITGIKEFSSEIEEHVKSKKCSSGKCLAMTQFYIETSLCKGCGKCIEVCPEKCIEGKSGYVSMIDSFDCSRCGKCIEVCENGAINKISGRTPKLPNKPVRVKGSKIVRDDSVKESTEKKSVKRKRSFAVVGKAKNEEKKVIREEKKMEVNIMKTLETDVVIVAAGPAGLASAISVGENGLKSIVLEKSSTTGGAANMGMGPLGIDTKIQKACFNNISVEDALHMHMEYTHYRVDGDLVQAYFNKSADTIEWLEDMGVQFAGAFRYFKESEATWHIVKPENGVIGPRAASSMIKIMTERAKELGSEIYLETAAVSLITEDGKVCGVTAVDKDGNGIEVRGKAVIVATGGFGNNSEMIKDEFGLTLGEDFFPFRIPGITGDGLKMMWEVGAQKYGTNIEAIYQLPDNLNWFLLDAVLRQPNLLINQLGDRFMDEGQMGNTTYAGNAIGLQIGNYGYCIMDEGILKEYKKNGPDIMDIVHPADAFLEFDEQAAKAVEQNYMGFIQAETIEELAEKLGIDEDKLRDTIETYNEMCECGVDSQFHKDQKYLHPITGKGKYLVGKYYLAAYGTVGGVRINKFGEVLNADSMPIEGLYSAGSDANTIYGDSYNFTLPGNTMGFAINSGRMAGESVSEYINDYNN